MSAPAPYSVSTSLDDLLAIPSRKPRATAVASLCSVAALLLGLLAFPNLAGAQPPAEAPPPPPTEEQQPPTKEQQPPADKPPSDEPQPPAEESPSKPPTPATAKQQPPAPATAQPPGPPPRWRGPMPLPPEEEPEPESWPEPEPKVDPWAARKSRTRTKKILQILGGSLMGGNYAANAIGGAVAVSRDQSEYYPLFIPIVGPFISIHTARLFNTSCESDEFGEQDCGLFHGFGEGLLGVVLILDGLMQTAGAAILIAGTALPQKRPKRGFVNAAPPAPQLNVYAGPGSVHLQLTF